MLFRFDKHHNHINVTKNLICFDNICVKIDDIIQKNGQAAHNSLISVSFHEW